MHDPKTEHMHALKRVVRYVQGTLDLGLHLYTSSLTSLISYIDADWGGCPDTRRSTSDYCVFLGDNLISWSSKWQPTLSRSSGEAEYRGVANVVSESCWIRNLLLELHYPIRKPTLVYCSNVSAIYLSLTILFNSGALNTLRWIYTLFEKKLLVAKFVSFMFPLAIKLMTFSLMVFRAYPLMIFVPVSAYVNLPLQRLGCDRIWKHLIDSILKYLCT
ncbi:NBS-containing resistance-like protein [Trifolium pratense]|uniref:NBS-containing resistance-like protein n=1 Tax=Trifolium pratense TaxID=57577 RepID=A0A2K3JWK6_TRIPR|nr:NBS-containing resistance-like protein [Trifolium pratense]